MRKYSILILIIAILGLYGCSSSKITNNPTIKIYTRDTTSGTRDGFFSTIGFKEAISDNTFLVKGYVEVAGNGDMISSLKSDEYGIGYISLASLPNSSLRGLNYNGIIPTEENVLNGTYKLTRNFNYTVADKYDNQKEEEIVKAFIAFLSTKEGKATIIGNDGIVAINDDDPLWSEIKKDHPIYLEDNHDITIKFGGSTSVEKIAKALSSEFSLRCGNFQFEHNHTGSGDAYKRTQGNEKNGPNQLHIAFASREFKINDTEPLINGTYGRICIDAIVVVVNPVNSITEIDNITLKKIYDGTITNWKEV